MTLIALVAFVVLDILLALAAFRHTYAAPPRSSLSEPRPAPRPSPSPSADRTAVTTVVRPATSFLAVGTDGTVLRASRGSCRGRVAPLVEVSADGGRSFVEAPPRGLSEVLRADVRTRRDLTLVGLDPSCRPRLYHSRTSGAAWSVGAAPGGLWYLAPVRGSRTVQSPEGPRRTPCVPRMLSVAAEDVPRLLCRSGTILGTADVGRTWVTLGSLRGAVSVGYLTPSAGFGLAAADGCAAAVLSTADGGVSWDRLACLGAGRASALAASGDLVAAEVGTELRVSRDGGRRWLPRG